MSDEAVGEADIGEFFQFLPESIGAVGSCHCVDYEEFVLTPIGDQLLKTASDLLLAPLQRTPHISF